MSDEDRTEKIVKPGPGGFQRGRQPVAMTPIKPSYVTDGRQPVAMTQVDTPTQTPTQNPSNTPASQTPSGGQSPQTSKSSVGKD